MVFIVILKQGLYGTEGDRCDTGVPLEEEKTLLYGSDRLMVFMSSLECVQIKMHMTKKEIGRTFIE